MIICVSVNPAIDRRLRLSRLSVGSVNRAISSQTFAGGKAAHVAMAAKTLGEEPIWIGFLGGSTGDDLEQQLNELGIKTIAVRTAAKTRSNDEIIEADGTITEILEPGGAVSADEIDEMFRVCEYQMQTAKGHFCAVFSGSLPPGVSKDFYSELTGIARNFGGSVIVDTSGEALICVLGSSPDLIKPNREEAEKITNVTIDDEVSAVRAVRKLEMLGAKAVALSLGADGMLWSAGGDAIFAKPPKVDVVSTVGCGDASVAGLAVAKLRGLSTEDTIRFAVAAGAANCSGRLPGQIDGKVVKDLLDAVDIRPLPKAAVSTEELRNAN